MYGTKNSGLYFLKEFNINREDCRKLYALAVKQEKELHEGFLELVQEKAVKKLHDRARER